MPPSPASPISQHQMSRDRARYLIANLGLLLLVLVLTAASLALGSVDLSLAELASALAGDTPDSTEFQITWNLRLPRTLLALLVGCHFAAAGLILQCVTRNPLADPGVLGVSSGASLAIVTLLLMTDYLNAVVLPDSPIQLSLEWLPVAAALGGIASTMLVMALSLKHNLRPVVLTLNGVAVAAMANAVVMWLVTGWGGGRTETTVMWLAGSLYARDFFHLELLLPWTLLGLLLLPLLRGPLSLLRFDEAQARTAGLDVMKWRLISLAVAVVFAASAIAVSGPIGFVGLIVPHITRMLVGGSLRRQFLTNALIGACLTLAADLLSRTLLSPTELPAGALTTLLGIPVLLYLLSKQVGQHS